ncbi:MAG: cobalt-precorrin 5A hydrolase [Methanospirillum sp.]
MTRVGVIYLARFHDRAEKVAAAVDGDLLEYGSDIFATAFEHYDVLVAVMSAGIAVRGVAPMLRDKWTDPPLVVVSPDLRFVVPVLGGHHGGNALARSLAEAIGATAVISTATECAGRPSVEGIADAAGCAVVNRESTRVVNAAWLDGEVPVYTIVGPAVVIAGPVVSVLFRRGEYVVGIGCRRGVSAGEVEEALRAALDGAGITSGQVFAYATTVQKREEAGLRDGVASLGGSLVYLDDATLNRAEGCSPSRADLIGLAAGVAEPAAFTLAKHKEWSMRKTVYGRVTVAIAR